MEVLRIDCSKFVRFGFVLFALPLLVFGVDDSPDIKSRYAPYAGWPNHISLKSEGKASVSETWWQSPEQIRNQRTESDKPLSGLSIALDPGHVGGEWAEIEGRNFKIAADDFLVREGELVLEVAHRIEAKLTQLGAEVTLLRDDVAPINPKAPLDYFPAASKRIAFPEKVTWASLVDYSMAIESTMNRMFVVTGELIERARRVNEEIQPDVLVSLHMNAAPWPIGDGGDVLYHLVDSDHTHVLIFGCLSDAEFSIPLQQKQVLVKLINSSADIERELGQALGVSLGEATALPPSNYAGNNAVRLEGYTPYLWARNLMLLRYVECPVILLEPYIVNSKGTYPRLQQALENRRAGSSLAEDDILVEYTDAVVAGLLKVYGP